MTEQPLLPPPDEPLEPVVPPKPRRRDLVPWLYGLGFIILAVAILYIWYYPGAPDNTAADAATIHSLEQRAANIDRRLNQLEQRPVPDLGKITTRLDAIDAHMNALDGKIADQTQLASRLDALSGRIESLSGRDQSSLDAIKKQLDTVTGRIAALESNAGSVDAITKRLNRIARIQEASFALASGRPIGVLPDAPEALARYAHVAPPTEAELRLLFPRAAKTALAAQQPDERDAPFIDRVWDRAQGLITIRRGDNIVVGNRSAIILNHGQAALEAGDISGAVDAVETLKGQPAQAMANWLAMAEALLGARAALANMADHA